MHEFPDPQSATGLAERYRCSEATLEVRVIEEEDPLESSGTSRRPDFTLDRPERPVPLSSGPGPGTVNINLRILGVSPPVEALPSPTPEAPQHPTVPSQPETGQEPNQPSPDNPDDEDDKGGGTSTGGESTPTPTPTSQPPQTSNDDPPKESTTPVPSEGSQTVPDVEGKPTPSGNRLCIVKWRLNNASSTCIFDR